MRSLCVLLQLVCHNCSLIVYSAVSGSIETMTFVLDEVFEEVSAEDLTLMLAAAGSKGHTAAMRWLLQRGAGWPAELGWQKSSDDDLLCWPHTTVIWALEHGCPTATSTDETAVERAAQAGHTELMCSLLRGGNPYNPER
jgi:hypothetical protein